MVVASALELLVSSTLLLPVLSEYTGVLNLQLFSRQNHNLASISPLSLLHVSADLTLVECYMDWFLWIHALMLLKLAVKCCDGWGTSCASTKIGLGNITQ